MEENKRPPKPRWRRGGLGVLVYSGKRERQASLGAGDQGWSLNAEKRESEERVTGTSGSVEQIRTKESVGRGDEAETGRYERYDEQ